ncbi:Piso0_001664 [Millerozyma farinosa CBS 7064]|uniref:Piso0_001664 protein n=1 Tax=Pichia sorbitophila (strain ATCC MYA-4447 / BCRC 22081 / CBS 7064 / NBRC 10061 / NRRL Y-12695) TaxID=559304 RepID=G8YLE0_PICSO|nr:Piso0_001664 [Millerozyma farinosa CBS 7064]
MSKNRQICKYYANGNCKFGNSCRFSHEDPKDLTKKKGYTLQDFISPKELNNLTESIRLGLNDYKQFASTPVLSSFGLGHPAVNNLIDGRDVSFEELRLQYLEASQNNTVGELERQLELRKRDMEYCINHVRGKENLAARYQQKSAEPGAQLPKPFVPLSVDESIARLSQQPSALGNGNTAAANPFGQSSFGSSGQHNPFAVGATPSKSPFGTQNQTNSNAGASSLSGDQSGFSAFGKGGFGSSGFGSSGFGSANTAAGAAKPGFGSSAFGSSGFGSSSFGKPSTGSSAFGSSGFGSSGFGQAAPGQAASGQAGSGQSAFGSSGFGSSAFGQSASGQAASGSSGFGSSGFGSSGFGSSGFGKPSTGSSAFGSSGFGSSGFGSSGFGKASTGQSSFGSSGFGKPGADQSGSTSSPFGNAASQSNANSSPFASLGSSGAQASGGSAFGASGFGSFGNSAQGKPGDTNAAPSGFSALSSSANNQPNQSSPFGSLAKGASPFGSVASNTQNTQNQNNNTNSPFGSAPKTATSSSSFPSAFGGGSFASNQGTTGVNGSASSAPGLEELKQYDPKVTEAFQATKFELGHVPEVPPPLQLCQ